MATATVSDSNARQKVRIPPVSARLVYWFDWYLQRYFPNHFHAFAVSELRRVGEIVASKPLIVYLNHASWWDPLVALGQETAQ
jgi:1-acyl-sn-glycerol-3-phosphate acyltransferase